jgi:hypothetical protein
MFNFTAIFTIINHQISLIHNSLAILNPLLFIKDLIQTQTHFHMKNFIKYLTTTIIMELIKPNLNINQEVL